MLGDPGLALTWLANELSAHGLTLAAGQVVTTGTCAVPLDIRATGEHVSADYGGLGRIAVRFMRRGTATMAEPADTFDYVIVGAGAAGLDPRRAADRGSGRRRSACWKPGRRTRNFFIHLPAGFIKTLVDPSRHLAVQDRADRADGRAADLHDAGAHAGRVFFRQRHDLQSRPAGRPEFLGAARQSRLGL